MISGLHRKYFPATRYKQQAFTLIELMVTISVLAILIVVGIPGMTEIINNNRRTTTLNDFLADLHLARSEAVTRNMRVSVCPSKDSATCGGSWNEGRLVFADADGSGTLDAGEIILRVGEALTKFKVSSSEFTEFLSFRPNGRMMIDAVDDNSGEFTFCDHRGADNAALIIVSNSGRPYTSHNTLSGASPTC